MNDDEKCKVKTFFCPYVPITTKTVTFSTSGVITRHMPRFLSFKFRGASTRRFKQEGKDND